MAQQTQTQEMSYAQALNEAKGVIIQQSARIKGDLEKVKSAQLTGGKTALTLTAAVPAALAIGFLLLVFYFRARGGFSTRPRVRLSYFGTTPRQPYRILTDFADFLMSSQACP